MGFVVVSFEVLSRFCKFEKGGFCKEFNDSLYACFLSSNRKIRIKTILNGPARVCLSSGT